jgi:hypothetical protein
VAHLGDTQSSLLGDQSFYDVETAVERRNRIGFGLSCLEHAWLFYASRRGKDNVNLTGDIPETVC